MRLLLISLLFLAETASAQQNRWAVIDDPDGCTNVRSGPGPDAPVVFRVDTCHIFNCEKQPGEWWKLEVMSLQRGFSGKGFIHKSRVRFLSDMHDEALQSTCCRILEHVRQFEESRRQKMDRYRPASPKEDSAFFAGLSQTGNDLHENAYLPLLDLLPDYLIRTKDDKTLRAWLLLLIASEGSAAEAPSYALAECYNGQSDWVINTVRAYPAAQRKILYGHIYFGLLHIAPNDTAAVDKLEKILEEDPGMK